MGMTDRELLEIVAAKVGVLTEDVGGLKQDFGGMRQDVGGMRQDVGGLKQETGRLKAEMQEIKKTVIHIENDHGAKLEALFDGYVQNSEKLDRIEKEVTRQEEVILRKVK